MSTHPLPRLALLGLSTLALVACNAAPATGAPTAKTGPIVSAPASTAVPGTASVESVAPPPAWLLVGRPGEPDLHLVMATTGETDAMAIPDGAPAPGWRRVVTATADGDSTVVRDLIVQPGFGGPELRLDGHWQLPTVGRDPIPVGRSLDGSTIALVEGASATDAGVSRFAIVEHFLMGGVQTAGDAPLRLARIVELPGAFEYDTLSPDGRILYMVEHLDAQAGGAYQVRAVDVATGKMRDGVIVDKGNPDERMAGSAIAQVRRADGVVLTLYRGPEHPFIHALNSRDAWAICIDLPGARSTNPSADLDWDLAPSADGSAVFAVNASLGTAVDVDPTQLAVRRSASIGTTATAPIVLAKFGHGEVGPVGRRVVVSPDGKTVFAAGREGLAAIRANDLTLARRDLAGSTIDALGITPDGNTLFALVHGEGRIVGLDAANGQFLGSMPGSGFDRLLAVAPW